jgi:predicted DNA-binding transcriptional regulator YafY
MTSVVMIGRYPDPVRASRLVGLLGLLQAQGRMTTGQLAAELEISPRTVLRDIEALSSAGIPVYATRGRRGGFELIDGFSSELPGRLGERRCPVPGAGRARIRVSPRGRRLAALQGRPAALRIRHGATPAAGRADWAEAWVRIESVDAAVLDLLALGPEVEVLHPPQLRAQLARAGGQIADLHRGPP